MKEYLILVSWMIRDELEDDDITLIPESVNGIDIYIGYSGIGVFMKELISDAGNDILNEKDVERIKTYIGNQLNPDFKIKDLYQSIKWRKPSCGEFIAVMGIDSFKSNHPLDPEEWDMNINFLGVLGEDVKLVV